MIKNVFTYDNKEVITTVNVPKDYPLYLTRIVEFQDEHKDYEDPSFKTGGCITNCGLIRRMFIEDTAVGFEVHSDGIIYRPPDLRIAHYTWHQDRPNEMIIHTIPNKTSLVKYNKQTGSPFYNKGDKYGSCFIITDEPIKEEATFTTFGPLSAETAFHLYIPFKNLKEKILESVDERRRAEKFMRFVHLVRRLFQTNFVKHLHNYTNWVRYHPDSPIIKRFAEKCQERLSSNLILDKKHDLS